MTFTRWAMVILIAAIAAGTIFWITNKPATAGYSAITADELQAKINTSEKMVIIDLREPELYAAGHIPGAKNIPFDQFNDRVNELNRADEIVLVCHMGSMGEISGSLLVQQGFNKVSNLSGGMTSWRGSLAK